MKKILTFAILITLCTLCSCAFSPSEDAQLYSQGLVYQTLDANTCAVVDLGTCTDTELRIPPISPSGQTVT